MRKTLVIFCFAIALFMPAIVRAGDTSPRPEDGGTPALNPNWQSNPNKCLDGSGEWYYCRADTKHKAKKKHDTGTIILISVATTAAFAGAMYYLFKKKPSENNPGQVKFAEF